jgi:hypothetical protein
MEFGCLIDGGNGHNQGFTLAIAEENTSLVKKCLEYGGMDLHFRSGEPLQTAVRSGNLEIVKMVAEADNTQNFKEGVCLACEDEHLSIIDYLITKVDINDLKHEPLERAAYFESTQSVKHLIDNHQYPVNTYDNSFVFTAIQSKNEEFNSYIISKTEKPQAILSDSAVMDFISLYKPELTSSLFTRITEEKKNPRQQTDSKRQQIVYPNQNQQNTL